ncbi:PhzF family phenazine biosynthesis protein [Aneurinibacillus tyrosinisolvens]|uniref:PhzF family phenazine biosynthesis protein n=1 Tax=Aneurinibacillus tyrosinisolvens TaxID=1443435 RepID=UPI00069C4E61|nr:PhzF family phenazine biosynthesis protein [Aneurinibacillus tyrosinisolvens]
MKNETLSIVHTKVFASAPQGGNPCPVVFGGENLSTEHMQALAAEFGEETVFVLPPENPEADIRLRYFVPNHEMEMCVHATVGAATVLKKKGTITKPTIKVETPLGIITVKYAANANEFDITVEQFPPVFSSHVPSRSQIASALGIDESDIDESVSPIQSVSTSRAKLIVPVRSEGIVHAMEPDFEKLWSLCDEFEVTGVYPYALKEQGTNPVASARQFPRRAGYNEDPATGVAASALGAYLANYNVVGGDDSSEWTSVTIQQGDAMGKPSVLHAECTMRDSEIIKTQIRGQAAIVSEEEKIHT